MPNSLEDIVSRLRTGRGMHRFTEEPVPLGAPRHETVAAIDGGTSMLWSNGRSAIGVVRWGYVVYDPSFSLLTARAHSEFLILEDGRDELDDARHRHEVETIREAAGHAPLVLVDGGLDTTSGPQLGEALDAVTPETTVVGVSKKSSLSIAGGDYPETWFSLPPCTYTIPGAPLSEGSCLWPGATLTFASLHAHGPTLRIDVAGDEVHALEVLRHYAGYRLCPGYPFPLIEAHRLCCLDDKKPMYETLLRKEMERQGLLGDYIRGKIRKERAAAELHTALDGLV